MSKISTARKYFKWIIPVVWAVAVAAAVLCHHYADRPWNARQFETFNAVWDFFVAYLLEAIGLAVFFVAFLICSKKSGSKIRKLFSAVTFSLLCAGCLAVVVTLISNCAGLSQVVKNYKLDCQLESDNSMQFREAINALIPKCYNVSYFSLEPNEYILKSARSGYPKAQNAMGCFFHQRALLALHRADYKEYGTEYQNLIKQSETDFDHAIYWFLKAAQSDYGISQTNLGRMFMGDLASNRYPDTTLAKQWLIKAIENSDVTAYYYLGKIYSEENLRDAYIYWSKGAELGNEDCARELEKPEFAMGMPEDRPVVEVAVADTCVAE